MHCTLGILRHSTLRHGAKRQARAHVLARCYSHRPQYVRSHLLLQSVVERDADADRVLFPIVVDQALAIAEKTLDVSAERAKKPR
jgi:hypothetical protein